MIDLAREVGCSYGHLRMAEQGHRQVSTVLAVRLARGLSRLSETPVTIDDFTSPKQRRVAA